MFGVDGQEEFPEATGGLQTPCPNSTAFSQAADEPSEERLKESSYEFRIPKESPTPALPASEDTSTREGTAGGPPDLNSLGVWAIWPPRSLSSKGWELHGHRMKG